jgi:acyl carrier protein
MSDGVISSEVRRILCQILKRNGADGFEIQRDQEPAWDSLKHVEIIFAIEDRFSVRFTEAELRGFSSCTQITQAVERHLAS